MNIPEHLKQYDWYEPHQLWLRGEGGARADLREANLQEANLQGANLQGADLREAELQGADLWEADLRGADLWGADIRRANLREANLRGADIQGADIQGANLQGANLREADLWGANLWGAIGIHRLNMVDPRGYEAIVVTSEQMVKSGCRYLTIPDALEHWGATPDCPIAASYVRAINEYVEQNPC